MLKGMILKNSIFEKSWMKNRDLKQANYSDEITNMKSKFNDFGVKWRSFEVHWLMITFPPQNLGLTPLIMDSEFVFVVLADNVMIGTQSGVYKVDFL